MTFPQEAGKHTTQKSDSKFRIGVMLNSMFIEHWMELTLRKLLDDGHQLVFVLVNNAQAPNPGLLYKLVHYPYRNILYRLYNRYVFRPEAKKIVSVKELVGNARIINCSPVQNGYFDSFEENTIKEIKVHQADFILRFGFNILKGEILKVAKYGVWSYHHDDEQKYRGGPPGFWEIYKKDHVNGVILQQLTEKLDAGIILKKGYFKTVMHSYKGQINQLYYECINWPVQTIKAIQSGQEAHQTSTTIAPIYKAPGNLQFILFVLKMIKRRIGFHLDELLKIEDWNTGIIRMTQEDIIDAECGKMKAEWMHKAKKSRFAADPFLFQFNNTKHIAFEDYDYKQHKGKISSIPLGDINKKSPETRTLIEEDFHLAYPYVFEHDNKLYCIPESFENSQIRLYEFIPDKFRFEFRKALISGIKAIDTTLFRHGGYWWLFFTEKHLPSVHLYAYYSKEIFGDYQPHKLNPVKTDIRSARPAGKPFIIDNKLYRPAQDCAKTYGDKLVINRVDQLSPVSFKETVVKSFDPIKNSKFNKALHTLNTLDDITIIDGKRFTFLWENFWYQVRKKVIR